MGISSTARSFLPVFLWFEGPASAFGISVAVALAGVFAILINKIRKIMEIFE